MTNTKSILFLSANPRKENTLRLHEEEREIKNRLKMNGYGEYPLTSNGAVRPRDIQQALLDSKPQIVHFSGHGSGETGLVFENEQGDGKLISSEALANLFKLFSNEVECVVLNACYSEHQAREISKYIDYVIGMNNSINDKAAIEFSVGFYGGIAAGENIEFSYELGCNASELAGISGNLIPVLHKKKEDNNLDKKDCLIMESIQSIAISNEFKQFLMMPDIVFPYRNQESVGLGDIFVFPDLKIIEEDATEIRNIQGEKIKFLSKTIIFGEEQSGKTTLAKKIFFDAYNSGVNPLLINGKDIKTKDPMKLLKKSILEQYSVDSYEDFLSQKNLLLIIDDFCKTNLRTSFQKEFIQNIQAKFSHIMIFADHPFHLVYNEYPELDNYQKLEILPFGHARRTKLIEKWINLQFSDDIESSFYWKKVDELKRHLDSLVRQTIVPAKPFYLLLLLQSFESVSLSNFELTSYGHYYQYLIYQSLERVKIKKSDFDAYINILSELGKELLDTSHESLSEEEQDTFFEKYSEKFINNIDKDKVIEDLIKSSILEQGKNGLKFRYRYLFYFFAAKNLAESLHKGEYAQAKIQELIDKIHLEKAANIVIFLTHHSKDPWILEQILYSVMEIFCEKKEASLLPKSLGFLQDFIDEIPEIVLEQRDPQKERLKEDEQRDYIESKNVSDNEDHSLEDVDLDDFIKKVNKTFKAMDVCGQILRNRLGSLEKDSLELFYSEALSVSLRFLGILLDSSEFMKDEVIRKIESILKNHPKLSEQDITHKARGFYLYLNYWIILAMLYKMGFSLGSSEGKQIYEKITKEKDIPAVDLVQQIIDLQFNKKLDHKKLSNLHKHFSEENPICDILLKHIVIRYSYMHELDYKDRQRISDYLGIPMQTQRSISLAGNVSNRGYSKSQ